MTRVLDLLVVIFLTMTFVEFSGTINYRCISSLPSYFFLFVRFMFLFFVLACFETDSGYVVQPNPKSCASLPSAYEGWTAGVHTMFP